MINKTLAKMKTSFIPLMLNIINLGAGLRIASLDVPKYAKVILNEFHAMKELGNQPRY